MIQLVWTPPVRFFRRLLICLLLLPLLSRAQNKTLSGTVKDETGKPLEGVSVTIKGSAKGALTDSTGHFSISVSPKAILVFSSVGFDQKEQSVSGLSTLTISLHPKGGGMGEVVVVGYGSQKKADLTGAVSTVDAKMIENRPVTSAVDGLQGTAPGLVVTRTSGQPGLEGWSLNVRGFSSLNGTNQPLVVIDGVPNGNLNTINPNDIATISILKDAAAAAIYGARAASGVVIITTKLGKSGKVNVDFNESYVIKKAYDVPQRIDSWRESIMQDTAASNAQTAQPYTQQQINWMKSTDSNYIAHDPYNDNYYYNLNQVPILMRNTTPSQSYNVDVRGGDERTQYYFGGGYYKNQGVLRFGPDANERYNATFNVSTRLSSIFNLDARLSYNENLIQQPTIAANGEYGLFYNLYQLRNRYPIFLPGSTTDFAYTGSGSDDYAVLSSGSYNDLIQNQFNGVFTLRAGHFIKGLDLQVTYNPYLEQDNNNIFNQQVPLWAYNTSGVAAIKTYTVTSASMQKTRTTQTSYDLSALANYSLDVHNDHHFHLLAGFEDQYYDYDYLSAYNNALVNNNLASLNYTSNANLPPSDIGDNVQTNAWQSFFGRFNYNYKEKYYLEATVRNDASSRLSPGHQRQAFPSVSAAWRLSKENWFNKALPFFDEFKLRGSWGKLGNAQLGSLYTNNYNYIATLNANTTGYPFNNQSNIYVYQSSLPSPSLGWETITTADGGLDIELFKHRLQASFDYFERDNDNVLVTLNEPATLGVSPSQTNAASIRDWGWEGSLGWRDRVGKVTYFAKVNVWDDNNKVTRYDGNVVISQGVNNPIPGLPINSIFGYKAIGYFQSKSEVSSSPAQFNSNLQGPGDIKYADINHDGVINGGIGTLANHGDMVYLGNTSPRYNFGINLGAAWKGFDLSAFFQGVGKRAMLIDPSAAQPFVNSWRMPWKINEDYWTPQHPNALFPRLLPGGGTNTNISSKWVQNAAYIRLKNLQLGYSLPTALVNRARIQAVRIYFSGQDLWEKNKMWFKYYDAEDPTNASFQYPFFRSYSFGLNVTF